MDEHTTGRGDRVTQRRLSEPRIARHVASMRQAIDAARDRKEAAQAQARQEAEARLKTAPRSLR